MTEELLVRDVMSKPVTIAKSSAITEALDRMIDIGIDPLIVVNHNTVVGTVSRMTIADKLGSKKNSTISPNAIHVANSVEEDFTTVYPDQDLDVLVPLLQRYKLVVVFDSEHHLIGQVTAGDMLRKMRPAGTLLDHSEKVYTIDSEDRVVHLRRRMLDDGIQRFVVTEKDQPIGIVTETDVAVAMRKFREIVEDRHQDHRIRNLLVRDIMSAPLVTIDVTGTIDQAVEQMVSKNICAIPITEQGRLIGIVTRASLIQAL
ncbi:MAG: CBS domain-containing protein [Methanomicrobiales archaeon]|jgi:predicted transcriptional regulator|nr:CBS domain-containing protein [Methanomicrobiales archaeon]